MNRILITGIIYYLFFTVSAFAGKADVVEVKIKKAGKDTYNFHITVRHSDSGWEHYADRWEILSPGRKVLATRVLAHPHVNEQPFTRSLYNVKIPSYIKKVIIRAHDKKHGQGGKEITVKLPN